MCQPFDPLQRATAPAVACRCGVGRCTVMRRLRPGVLLLTTVVLCWNLLVPAVRPVEAGKPSPSPTATPTPTPTASPTPTPTASPKPKPSARTGGSTPTPTPTVVPSLPPPGSLPSGSTRTNPLPSSPTAPALITVNPSTIDPRIDNVLSIFGRNLSAQTLVQVDTVPATIVDAPDAWHLFVRVPAERLEDGNHNILLYNPDGQSDLAMGALLAHTPGLPFEIYLLAGLGLIGLLALSRMYRWLTR